MGKIEARFEKEMEVGVPLQLEVAAGNGDISVQRGEDGKLRVTSDFQVRADSQDEAEEVARSVSTMAAGPGSSGSRLVRSARRTSG